jgi:hypothetical protein
MAYPVGMESGKDDPFAEYLRAVLQRQVQSPGTAAGGLSRPPAISPRGPMASGPSMMQQLGRTALNAGVQTGAQMGTKSALDALKGWWSTPSATSSFPIFGADLL